MPSLEDKLMPPPVRAPWRRDLPWVAMLTGLSAVLIGGDVVKLCQAVGAGDADTVFHIEDHLIGHMTSPYLLSALGFMLALRCGAVDLSVWVNAGLGGAAAAAFINARAAGAGAVLSTGEGAVGLALGAAAGLAVGAVNGVLVALARLPSVVVTLVTALGAMWILQAAVPNRQVEVPIGSFEGWHIVHAAPANAPGSSPGEPHVEVAKAMPLAMTRRLLVVGAFAAVVMGLFVVESADRIGCPIGRKWKLLGTLCASGLLAAAGGAFWLLEHGCAPVPTRPVDDLRVPAAAILAGGALLSGRTRTLFAAAALPVSLLLATVWRQEVWSLHAHGYALQLVLLVGMTIAAHIAIARLGPGRARPGTHLASAAMTISGILLVAGAAGIADLTGRRLFHAGGMAVWLTGAVLLVAAGRGATATSSSHDGAGTHR